MRRGWFGLIGLLFLLVGCTTTSPNISGTISAPGGNVSGTVVKACAIGGTGFSCANAVSVTINQSGSSAPFSLSVPTGNYVIVAQKDLNSSGRVDNGESYGCAGQQGVYPSNTCSGIPAPSTAVAITLQTATFAANEPFNITLRFNGTISTAQQTAFNNAANRWGQVITRGFPDIANISIPANACGSGAPAFSGNIDDLLIDVRVAPIDGAGKILARAQPCIIRISTGLSLHGIMEFDSADVDTNFTETVLHEMGHVLGFGTLWTEDERTLLVGGGSIVGNAYVCGTNPSYVGSNAVREWQALGGTGNVPVEDKGSAGSCDGHWRDSVFGNELMSSFYNGSPEPMSRLTIGGIEDLGYSVDYTQAQPYSLPKATSLAQSTVTPRGYVLFDPSKMVYFDDMLRGTQGQTDGFYHQNR